MSPHRDTGSAHVAGLAILENARVADPSKPQTITFDAHMYTPETPDSGVFALSFYNAANRQFDADSPEVFFIDTTLAKIVPGAATVDPERLDEYVAVGDIVKLYPSGLAPDSDAVYEQPVVHISGIIDYYSEEMGIMQISPKQYASALRPIAQLRGHGTLPVTVYVDLDSPRYKGPNGQDWSPKPKPGTIVELDGYLRAIPRCTDSGEAMAFDIGLDNIVFLSKSPAVSVRTGGGNPPDDDAKGAGKRKFKFGGETAATKRRRVAPPAPQPQAGPSSAIDHGNDKAATKPTARTRSGTAAGKKKENKENKEKSQ